MSTPFNLPEGTVRALLAVIIVGATIAYWLAYKTVPTELLAFAGVVVGYYFGTRQGEALGYVKGLTNGNSSTTTTNTTVVEPASTDLEYDGNIVYPPSTS
jgi:hypothetical protein